MGASKQGIIVKECDLVLPDKYDHIPDDLGGSVKCT